MTTLTPRRALLISSPMIAAILVLVGGELLVPGLAESRLRDELRRSGTVRDVSVRATPSLKLLWGDADRVAVHMGEVRAGAGDLAALIDRTRPTDELDARLDLVQIGPLRLRDVVFSKRGENLTGEAAIRTADLRDLPAGIEVRPVGTEDGSLLFEGSAELFGVRASGTARLSARDGRLVVAPETGVPLLGGLATFTVFSDPRVVVRTVAAEERPDGFVVSATGRLGRAPR